MRLPGPWPARGQRASKRAPRRNVGWSRRALRERMGTARCRSDPHPAPPPRPKPSRRNGCRTCSSARPRSCGCGTPRRAAPTSARPGPGSSAASRAEAMGDGWAGSVHPDDRDAFEACRAAMRRNEPLRRRVPAASRRRHVRDGQRPGLRAGARRRRGAVPRRRARGDRPTGRRDVGASERGVAVGGRRRDGRGARREGSCRPLPDRERRDERDARRRARCRGRTHRPRARSDRLGPARRARPGRPHGRRSDPDRGRRRGHDRPDDEEPAARSRRRHRRRDRRGHRHLRRTPSPRPGRASRSRDAGAQLFDLGPGSGRRRLPGGARRARGARRRARPDRARRAIHRDHPTARVRKQARPVALGVDRRGGHADHARRP